MFRAKVSIPVSALALVLVASCAPSGADDVQTEVSQSPLLASLVQINAGGAVSGAWQADAFFVGGRNGTPGKNPIVTTGITAPAPQDVYQTSHVGTTTYTIGPFSPSVAATVTLHFAETYHTTPKSRLFNVDLDGTRVLTNFDIWATAAAMAPVSNPPKGSDRAVVESFDTTTDAKGNITIVFTTTVDNALISGIQVFASMPRLTCTPGTKRCGTGDVETCNANQSWTVTTTCSGNTPQCDPTAFTCVKASNGGACSSGAACTSGFCVGGTCCQTACTGSCDTGLACGSNGVCAHKQTGTFCKTVTGSNPGYNDFQLACTSTGACAGPMITCGNTGQSCTADGTMACCQRPIVMGGTTTWTQTECGAESTCAGNYGENCRSNRDCPTSQFCCFDGGYGFGWSVCHTTACAAMRQECQVNTDCAGVPNTTCQNYNGTDSTCF